MAKQDLDAGLANLYDYTKFHIGMYATVFAASAAAAKFASPVPGFSLVCVIVAMVCFMVAGACGGVIASHVPHMHREMVDGGVADLWTIPIGPSLASFTRPCRWWAIREHLAFWVGAFLCFLAVLWSLCGPDS